MAASLLPLTATPTRCGAWPFSPDGRTLATASADHTVRLWDVTSRHELNILTGHTDWVWGVAFSPDGRTLATASADATVRLWDVADRRQPKVFTGHTGNVRGVAFSPDGRTLATASADATVRLWDMDLTLWQKRLCNLAGRNLTPQQWDEFLPHRPYQRPALTSHDSPP